MSIVRAAQQMALRMGTLSDADFRRKIDQIGKCMTRDKFMPAFLNKRLEIDPQQVFRVLRLGLPRIPNVTKKV